MSSIFKFITDGIYQLGEGGFLMIPLLILSLIVHALIFERAYNLRRSVLLPDRFIDRIYRVLEKGNLDMALSLCETRPGPLTNILKAGISNHNVSEDDLRVVLRVTARPEKMILRKRLKLLAFLGSIAVLIGLFGTVTGIYGSFTAVFISDKASSMGIAKGVSVALLTTVGGLSVALPAMIAYAYFGSKVENLINEMTLHSLALVRILTGDRPQVEKPKKRERQFFNTGIFTRWDGE